MVKVRSIMAYRPGDVFVAETETYRVHIHGDFLDGIYITDHSGAEAHLGYLVATALRRAALDLMLDEWEYGREIKNEVYD